MRRLNPVSQRRIAVWMDYLLRLELQRFEDYRGLERGARLKLGVGRLAQLIYGWNYDRLRRDRELAVVKTAKQHDANTLYLLRTVPGIGEILSLVLLDEIHDIQRFPRVQEFVSYCRLVTCAQEAAGQRYGTAGPQIGNPSLPWAFSEAAVLF